MVIKKNIRTTTTLLFLALSAFIIARDSPYTRKGTGPKYWIAYEYCYDKNIPIPESVWQSNIDWVNNNLKLYGYDMICNDGWIEQAQTVNENGFIVKYNSDWEHDFSYWHKYLSNKGLKMGVYYNPMWLTKAAYDQNLKVIGTDYRTKDIVGEKQFNSELYWVDVDKPGAKEWIQEYVKYFKELGTKYLRVDFLENYENNYGTAKYDKALKWIAEAAGNDLFLSLVMPNSFQHGATELKYGDMMRIDDDCFDGDWNFVSNRRRGTKKENWPQFANAFDGFVGFADIGKKGQMILDGDFMRMNKLANDDERRFLFSLMIMGGSALAVADQYNTIGNNIWVYQNKELNELNAQGFVAKPISNSYLDAENSSRWIGQLKNGDWIVGLFNREDTPQLRSIDFQKELKIKNGRVNNVRDLWKHKDFGRMKKLFSVTLKPHECRVIRITPSKDSRKTANKKRSK